MSLQALIAVRSHKTVFFPPSPLSRWGWRRAGPEGSWPPSCIPLRASRPPRKRVEGHGGWVVPWGGSPSSCSPRRRSWGNSAPPRTPRTRTTPQGSPSLSRVNYFQLFLQEMLRFLLFFFRINPWIWTVIIFGRGIMRNNIDIIIIRIQIMNLNNCIFV